MQRKYCPIAWGFIVDFAIGPVTQFVLNLPNGEVEFFFGGIQVTEEARRTV